MGFSRQEYWSGLPCPPPGDLLDPGIEPTSLTFPVLAGGFFTTSAHLGNPCHLSKLSLASPSSTNFITKFLIGKDVLWHTWGALQIKPALWLSNTAAGSSLPWRAKTPGHPGDLGVTRHLEWNPLTPVWVIPTYQYFPRVATAALRWNSNRKP